MFWDTFLVLSLNHFALQATLYQSPPSVEPTTVWHPMKRVRKEFATSYPVAKVIAINGMTTSFSRDSTKEEYTAGGPPMLKRTRKEIAITQPEGVGDHDNAGSITSITAAKVIADMATLIASKKDTATEAPMFMPPLKEIAPCIATNGLPTCSSNNITKEAYTAGEPPTLKQARAKIVIAHPEGVGNVIRHPEGVDHRDKVGSITLPGAANVITAGTTSSSNNITKEEYTAGEPPMLKRKCKEIVVACPGGSDAVISPAYDVIGHPEGVVTPKYVGGTTSVSGPKTFQQSTQCTNGMLTKAKIDRNEAK